MTRHTGKFIPVIKSMNEEVGKSLSFNSLSKDFKNGSRLAGI